MDKNKLWRLIQAKEKQYQKNKVKRAIYTIILYTVVLSGLTFSRGVSGMDFLEIIGTVVGFAVIAGMTFAANTVIFHQLYEMSAKEEKELKDLKKLLDEMDKE